MIVETLLEFATSLIEGLFSGLSVLSLPLNLLTVLLDVFCYGVWVIGADLMAIVISSIVFWMGTKFTIGLVLFIWRLLPLT